METTRQQIEKYVKIHIEDVYPKDYQEMRDNGSLGETVESIVNSGVSEFESIMSMKPIMEQKERNTQELMAREVVYESMRSVIQYLFEEDEC